MALSNYEITRNKMRKEFTKYDQKIMIQKFSLEHDHEYLYLPFMKEKFRVHRKSGIVECSSDGFATCREADFNTSMTIYDILCYSKEDCHLSGHYCTLAALKGSVVSSGPDGSFFQNDMDDLRGKKDDLRNVCQLLGELIETSADVSVLLHPFPFLPVVMQYWDADDEFPVNLTFLFDENILDYMHYETIFYMTKHMISSIKRLIGQGLS